MEKYGLKPTRPGAEDILGVHCDSVRRTAQACADELARADKEKETGGGGGC